MKYAHLILLFASIASAQLQPPPSPTKPGQAQQDIRNDKDNARKAIDKTQFLTPHSNQETPGNVSSGTGGKTSNSKPASATKNGNWNLAEIFITTFTGFLVVLAGLQFWAMYRQADYMRRGLRISMRQTRIANRTALAAQASAAAAIKAARTSKVANRIARQAFIATHGPKITVKHVRMETPFTARKTGPVSFTFSVFNAGQTMAYLVRSTCVFRLGQGPPPQAFSGEDVGNLDLDNHKLLPGQTIVFRYPPPGIIRDFTLTEAMHIGNCLEHAPRFPPGMFNPGKMLYVIGRVDYTDEINLLHRIGFCRSYNYQTSHFEIYEDPNYEYGEAH